MVLGEDAVFAAELSVPRSRRCLPARATASHPSFSVLADAPAVPTAVLPFHSKESGGWNSEAHRPPAM